MLKEQVKKEMIVAMKSGDKEKKNTLSLIVSEITRVEMDKKAKLVTDARKEVARNTNIDVDKVVLSEEMLEDINKKAIMTEDEEIKVIEKMVKSANETIAALTGKSGKETNLEKTKKELEIYMTFMPAQMTEDEIKDTIEKVLDNLGLLGKATMKDKGNIMKELMPKVKGKADGKLVNTLLSGYLS